MDSEDARRRQIAAGLRRTRLAAGLTQQQLAERLYLTASAVRHYERARHPLRVEQLPVLAAALDTTVRALLVEMRLLRRRHAADQPTVDDTGPDQPARHAAEQPTCYGAAHHARHDGG